MSIPSLACQLHPLVSAPLRRAAAFGIAAALLSAWCRGSHDPALLYLLEASLVARRLGFAIARDFASDSPAQQACLFALAVLPLLGGTSLVTS